MSEWTESRFRGRWLLWSAALLLALLSIALYAPTVLFGYVGFDDTRILLGHPHLYDSTSFLASLREILVGHFPREEPLLVRDISWAAEARLFGLDDPWAFHLGNVLLNAANAVMLFFFLQHSHRRAGFAFAVAALFVLVPLHVEPVSWIMGRKDLLSAFFVLAALLAQGSELDATQQRTRRAYYVAGFVFLVCALFSKISAVTAFSLLLLHRVCLPYLRGVCAPDAPFDWRGLVRRTAPWLAPHAIASVAAFVWYHGVLSDWGLLGRGGPDGFDPEHLANVARFFPLTLALYARHLVWPSQLSAYYATPNVAIPLSFGEEVTAIVAAISIAALSALLWFRRRDLLFYWLGFFLFYAPYVGFAYVGFWMADRYLYLSCFCLIALGASAVLDVAKRVPRFRALPLALALLVAGSWTIQTWRQIPVWQSSTSLWAYEAARDKPSLMALQSHAKRIVAAAEESPSSKLVEAARAAIERGIAHEVALDRRPTSYRTPEQLQLARLHFLKCRLARIEHAPIEKQIEYAEQAFSLAPHRSFARELAALYFNAAGKVDDPEHANRVRLSLAYFDRFIRLSGPDPKRVAESRELLRLYDPVRFPFIRDEIASIGKALRP